MEKMVQSYTPVPYVYRESIEEEIANGSDGVVFYFREENTVDSVKGRILEMKELEGKGIFIFLDSDAQIRIDKIIVFHGNVGPAYDEYDAFSNVCLDCKGDHGGDNL